MIRLIFIAISLSALTAHADDCLKTLRAPCKQVAADEWCGEAHWADQRLSDKEKERLSMQACRNTRFTVEQWKCATNEVPKNGKPIEVAKKLFRIKLTQSEKKSGR